MQNEFFCEQIEFGMHHRIDFEWFKFYFNYKREKEEEKKKTDN